jgi:predicted alpha/beta-fold hydrolase
MKKIVLIFSFLCSVICSFAQIPKNLKTVRKANFTNGSYYLELLPKEQATKGIIVIFPGLFDHPYSIFMETPLTQECVKNGYIVIIPVLSKENDEFDLSKTSMELLDTMLNEVITSNNMPINTNIVMGGFSIGGTRAINFYIYNSKILKKSKTIRAVFAIDPPLDFERLINSDAKKGSNSLLTLLQKDLGDSLKTNNTLIKNYSIFSQDSNNNDSLPDFLQSKLRIYSEPDILWYMQNKKMDLYDMNIVDDAGYINLLKNRNINNKVELIITENKGFRKGTNDRNPHSWSILDVKDFLEWIK